MKAPIAKKQKPTSNGTNPWQIRSIKTREPPASPNQTHAFLDPGRRGNGPVKVHDRVPASHDHIINSLKLGLNSLRIICKPQSRIVDEQPSVFVLFFAVFWVSIALQQISLIMQFLKELVHAREHINHIFRFLETESMFEGKKSHQDRPPALHGKTHTKRV